MPTDNPTNVYATGDGVTKTYSIPFAYLDRSHVKVTVDGVAVSFTFTSPGTVELATAPAVGTTIRRYRETPEDALVTWADGAVILGKHLNLSQTQSLYIAQEAHDYAEQIAEEAKQFALDSVQGTINTALASAVASLQAVIVPDRDAAAASATSAAASATTATAGASTATTKAAEATSAATDAAAFLADFQKRYLGAKTANPTVDNAGNPLVAGALYFNTAANEMRVYDGTSWSAAYIPSGSDVASFNGRTGAVTPATDDYSIAMITGLSAALAGKAALTGAAFTGDISTSTNISGYTFNASGLIVIGAGHYFYAGGDGVGLLSGAAVKWQDNNTSRYTGAADLGIVRNAAGVLEVNNGTAGQYRDVKVRAAIADTITLGSADLATSLAAKANTSDVNTALAAKLDASAYTAADVMTKVLANDGAGSGLDADKWKGASYTVSTATPSGGADGDFWFERQA